MVRREGGPVTAAVIWAWRGIGAEESDLSFLEIPPTAQQRTLLYMILAVYSLYFDK